MMTHHSKCKDVPDENRSISRDYSSDCFYVSENNTSLEWTSSVVRELLRFYWNNDHYKLLLENLAKTPTKPTNRLVLGRPNNICLDQRGFSMLLSTVERAIPNDPQMKNSGCDCHMPDEYCETWMSITASTRLQSQIPNRSE
ncbi:hypothetical protein Y032_0491g2391 [Ancylostoma ceylanicum]|uniref:Uncharacterized protein n=1 Tax=Ancylostoma ceylanicum TaxID=53326 RepID=A0A016WV74_9BILA|nr:hypothetical protein Y032_0491g2391 [Ancylostoma ceylanicum]